MKKTLILFSILSLFAMSCSEQKKEDKIRADIKKKTEELEKLRNEIATLEMDLAKESGTTANMGKPVRVVKIDLSAFNHSIDIQGRVDADESVSVGPQMPGLVKSVNVHAGDKVSAGQVLAVLDAGAMNQQLAALKIQRDLAQDVYNRQKNLWDQKIGTELQYLQAKTQYEAIEKQISAMQEQIGMGSLKAPIAGTVDQINIKVGEMAAPGFSSISIVGTGKLRVKGEVAEGYVSKVQTGNPVNLYFPDADKTVETTITYSGRIINKVNRTFNIEVVLPATEKNIVPNMIAVIRINDYSNASALVIPLSAIQQTADGKMFVFVAVKNKDGKLMAEKRTVAYTNTYDGSAELDPSKSEIHVGDQLITDGSADLNQGDLISAE
ncbi:efflux RND transporter periplasmic adaptor subunit [soil metagenome]